MLLKLLFIGLLINTVVAIQLEGLSTKKPRNTKYTLKPNTGAATVTPSTISTYRINATNGATCILIKTDALLSITYRNNLNDDAELNLYLPDHPKLSGECDEDISSMSLSTDGFDLKITFKKTPGGERWYISNIEVSYTSSNPLFVHIDRPGLNVKLSTRENTLLFPTPVGKSYICDQEKIITMFAQNERDTSGHTAKLYLRDLKMQSFMYKAANSWGPTFQCSATGTYRDETAPVAVGSTLAVVVLCSVTGYGIWRYLKVKKVQYGSME